MTSVVRQTSARAGERSAGFQTCSIADFQIGAACDVVQAAGLETRDTAQRSEAATKTNPASEPQRRDERSAAEPQPKWDSASRLSTRRGEKEKRGRGDSQFLRWNFFAACDQLGLLQCSAAKPQRNKKGRQGN